MFCRMKVGTVCLHKTPSLAFGLSSSFILTKRWLSGVHEGLSHPPLPLRVQLMRLQPQ